MKLFLIELGKAGLKYVTQCFAFALAMIILSPFVAVSWRIGKAVFQAINP
jgi:hypothetical protein